MPVIQEVVEELTEQISHHVIDAIATMLPSWELTEQDATEWEPSLTPEQREYYNRGVRSVQGLLDAIKSGDI